MGVAFTRHLSTFLLSAKVQAEFGNGLLGDQSAFFHRTLLVHLLGHSIPRMLGFFSAA